MIVNNELFYAFLILQVIFFLYTALIFVKLTADIVNKEEHTVFRLLLLSYMFYVLFSTLWTMCEFRMLILAEEVLYFVYELTTISVVTVCFMVFLFIILRLAPKSAHKPYMRWLSPLPYVFVVLLIATNYWTRLVYTIDASQHMVFGPAFNGVPIITVAYFFAVLVIAVVKYFQTTAALQKRTYRLMIINTVFIFISAYIDGYFRYLTVLPAAAFGIILFIFINIQESGINSDKLTLMNNRRKADDYLADRMRIVTPRRPMYLYVFDVNSFKQINDKYGHAEGDEALVMTASAIKRTVGKYTGFAARYGGDEFIIAWMPDEDNPDWNLIPDTISSNLKQFCAEKNKPYELTISWGCAKCSDPSVPAQTYFAEADQELYEMKRRHHRQR